MLPPWYLGGGVLAVPFGCIMLFTLLSIVRLILLPHVFCPLIYRFHSHCHLLLLVCNNFCRVFFLNLVNITHIICSCFLDIILGQQLHLHICDNVLLLWWDHHHRSGSGPVRCLDNIWSHYHCHN